MAEVSEPPARSHATQPASAGSVEPPTSASVAPGMGWPGDVATGHTSVAHTSEQVVTLSAQAATMRDLDAMVSVCRACPRLVEWREHVSLTKRASFATQEYWGRPVTGFGPADASIAIVGLAPAAHGGNRTGRVFTGDPSGDWLYSSLYRVGLANQPASTGADDELQLNRTRVLAAVRCAPPRNRPTTTERDRCAPWLHAELTLIKPTLQVIVALGGFAWHQVFKALAVVRVGDVPTPRPRFGHGNRTAVGPITVLGCYHPSQRNTATRKLSSQMLDDVLGLAAALGSDVSSR